MAFIDKSVSSPGVRQESAPSISAAAHRRHDHLPIVAADTATGACAGAGACGGGGGGGNPVAFDAFRECIEGRGYLLEWMNLSFFVIYKILTRFVYCRRVNE
jgi:hypothetical protein